ncbi:GntR family transcriptional regulator [Roseomonas sp. HF4]|uniref:GntR family transcriptional regulator n=1 Tax=Roseomonas sp. HF4 TaxID=2562313 RepID=UPI0010C03620|nr:GntR family transcriptional regulator [Roseomonas sp. HF4]
MAVPVSAARGETAAARAFREIRARILSGALPAGALVLEGEMAVALGLSRTPVREAMVRLADEGLVHLRPRHGMQVKPLSADDMREIYDVLTELEAAAARRCAERGLDAATLASLESAVAAMDAALARDDLDAWADADADFHRRLTEASGNAMLAAVVASFADRAHRWRMATLRLRPRPDASNDDHRAVVAAIRARDPARAEAIHRAHRAGAGEMLARLLERLAFAGD